jgi:tRNA dimethylallyltransferase
VVDPGVPFTVADYQRLAVAAIEEIHASGRVAILQGGTGLYLRALLDGWNLAGAAPDPALRAALEERLEEEGPESLQAELRRVDPRAADLAGANPRRLIRALEILSVTGQKPSEARRAEPPAWSTTVLGLEVPLAELDRRIEERVSRMLGAGWIEEVERVGKVFPNADWKRLGHGYPEIATFLAGQMTLEEVRTSTVRQVRQYARRQYTWFRADARVQWITADLEVALKRLGVGIMTSEAN